MRLILFIFTIVLLVSCKSAKERRACFELVSNNKSLEIKNFDELKSYTGVYWVKLLGAVWILDGEVLSEDEIKARVNENKFDILKVKTIDGDSIHFSCRHVPLYVLISTNNCIKKIN